MNRKVKLLSIGFILSCFLFISCTNRDQGKATLSNTETHSNNSTSFDENKPLKDTTHRNHPAASLVIPKNTGTNTTPALFTAEEQQAQLKGYPTLYDAVYQQQNLRHNTYVVPGLTQTETLDLNNQASESTEMDPQGLAVSQDYLFISAYSHDLLHHSVIYMLNRETGAFIKTIVLPSMTHAGGIAYDSKNDNLWLTSQPEDGASEISVMSLPQLESYNFEDTHEAISYQETVRFTDFLTASYITYQNHSLYVGTFNISGDGLVTICPIDNEGRVEGTAQDGTITINNYTNFSMPKETQGLTFSNQQMLVSTSYGLQNSHLLGFEEKNQKTVTIDQATKDIELPPYVEEICAFDNKLYILFESAAQHFTDRAVTKVDRVLVADLDLLLK